MKNRQIKYGDNPARTFIEQFDQKVDDMSRQDRENT